MKTLDDADIIRRVLNGETNQYEQLVKRYQGAVYSFLLRFTGSHSITEELAQETFMKAFANLKGFDRSRRFFPWIYTIAVNLAKDWGRKYTFRRQVMDRSGQTVEAIPSEDGLESEIEHKEDLSWLQKGLKRIPMENREALILRYHYDLSYKDIAEVFDISLSASKMRVHRGLKLLKQVLNDEKR